MGEGTEQKGQGSNGLRPALARNRYPGTLSYRKVSGCLLAVCEMEEK